MGYLPAELTMVLGAGLTLLAAAIFAVAAQHKLRTFTQFTGFVAGYRLLPATLVRPGSMLIIVLEVAAIAGALAAIRPLVYLPGTMLLLYALAMGVNLARGRNSIDCGCGGPPTPLSAALVARNLVLAITFFWAAGTGGFLELISTSPALLPIAVGFTVCTGIAYAAFNQLQANRGIHQRLWVQSA